MIQGGKSLSQEFFQGTEHGPSRSKDARAGTPVARVFDTLRSYVSTLSRRTGDKGLQSNMGTGELKVGLIGGTGEEGRGLALRWARAGARVTIGSRALEKARATSDELNHILEARAGEQPGHRIDFGENRDVIAACEFLLLTVPFAYAASALESHKRDFRDGAILIDITVPVSFEQGRVRYIELPEGSASEHLKPRLPENIPLVAAFKTEPAQLLAEIDQPLDCDSFVASDSKQAKARVMDAINLIEGLRPVDAGTLYSARTLERMTVLAIGINRRYKIKTARYRVVGLQPPASRTSASLREM
jgi:NADPH-dependent F420 reductase